MQTTTYRISLRGENSFQNIMKSISTANKILAIQ